MQNPPVFFQKIIDKSSNKNLRKNHRKMFEKSSPTHIFWTNPPSQWSGKQKVAKPFCFCFKNHRQIIEQKYSKKSSKNVRKIIPNPHFLDQPPFTVVRKAKSCKTLLFFSKKHRQIIEKSSKIIEKYSKNNPQPTFSGPTRLHSGQESKKLQNLPVVFFKNTSKNHRTIFEQSSKHLRQIILTGIHLQKIIQQILLPDINLPKIILPIFLPCLEHDLKRASTQPPSDISCAKWLQLNCFMAEAEGNPPKQAKQSQARQIKAKQASEAKQSKASERSKAKQSKAKQNK